MPKKNVGTAQKKWIFDTVALSNFLLCEAEWLLEKRYCQKGVISSQVFTEIEQGIAKGYPLNHIENFLLNSQFSIEEMDQNTRQIFTNHLNHLGSGEASCIAIASNKKYIVVTDDKKARITCQELKLPVTGTVGILKACCIDKLISPNEADEILDKMIANGFYSPLKSVSCLM